jgi:DNA-binding NarL/FixJ family response regulator
MLRAGTWVLLANTDAELAYSLTSALGQAEVGLVPVTTVASAVRALDRFRQQPELTHVVMDLDLPDGPAEMILTAMEGDFPRVRVLGLAPHLQGLRALSLLGRCMYVPSAGITADGLLGALKRTAAPELMEFATTFGLSCREYGVLQCVIEGLPIADTAERLQCRSSTIKTYVKRIFDKTGRGSQVELLGLLVEWLTESSARRPQATAARARLSRQSSSLE